MQRVFCETYQVGANHRIEVEVPAELGSRVKLIIVPDNSGEALSHDKQQEISSDDMFLLSAYDAVIEDDSEEDAKWEKYFNVR